MTNLNELDRLVQADHDALAEWNAARTAVSAALPRAHFESGWWRNREMAPGNAAFIEAVARSRAARDAHRMARAAFVAAASPDVVRALIARVRAAEAALTKAYPRALQAAADVVLRAEHHCLDLIDDGESLELLDDLANDIMDLSADKIDAFANEVERNHKAATAPPGGAS